MNQCNSIIEMFQACNTRDHINQTPKYFKLDM